MTPTPIHPHDCNHCRYLGSVETPTGWGDLYACERNPAKAHRSIIFRYGSDGPEYSSIPLSMADTYPTAHILRLAAALYRSL